jgi:capsular polysaccharide biosynthesis protein
LLSKSHEIIDFELHLKALDLVDRKIIKSDMGLVHINRLLFIPPVGHPTSFVPESYFFTREKYQKYFGVKGVPVSKKIFLTRRPGEFKRHLLNDQEVETALKKEGILYFDGKQSFQEIVQAFAQASHVAGVHGALFANNIYGNEKTKYLEYCPARRPVKTFNDQYKICDSYRHILVNGDDSHNIEIDIKEVLDFYRT